MVDTHFKDRLMICSIHHLSHFDYPSVQIALSHAFSCCNMIPLNAMHMALLESVLLTFLEHLKALPVNSLERKMVRATLVFSFHSRQCFAFRPFQY